MKKFFDFLKMPPLWFLCVVAVLAVGGAVGGTVFLTAKRLAPYALAGYIFLGVMAAGAGYCTYGILKILPNLSVRALKWSENKPFWNRLFTEYGFRAIFFAVGAFLINLAFAAYNGVIAVLNSSVWFGALAAYYVFLIVLRSIILIYHVFRRRAVKAGQTEERTQKKDTYIYGICGGMLVFLPIALSAAIAQMVGENRSFVYAGVTIYVYALYAFIKIGVAVYHVIKTTRSDEMTVRAAKDVGLADAMMSILALQTAMFHEFDAGDTVNVPTMNAVTGAIVCALTAALGIFMLTVAILRTRKKQERPAGPAQKE